MMAYGDPKRYAWLKDQFKKAGKKMDMGKSCLHFKSLDDIPVVVRVCWRCSRARCPPARPAASTR